jgi:hypothetical protein
MTQQSMKEFDSLEQPNSCADSKADLAAWIQHHTDELNIERSKDREIMVVCGDVVMTVSDDKNDYFIVGGPDDVKYDTNPLTKLSNLEKN